MSIAVRAWEASRGLYARAPERSLIPVVIAIDATARRRYPGQRSNRDRYTRFIRDSMRLITAVWLGRPFDACRIRAFHPALRATAGDGTVGLDDLLYHVLRSDILHEAGLAPSLLTVARGIEDLQLGDGRGPAVRLSHRLMEGCLAAVVLAPENAESRTPEPAPLYIRSRRYWINRLWGRRDYFCREVLGIDPRGPDERGEAAARTVLGARPAVEAAA